MTLSSFGSYIAGIPRAKPQTDRFARVN